MSNQWFQFKQFRIAQDRCAMKVGTDGVLLGAWADVPESGLVLDVGTGTGLIAMMVAQRSAEVRITALEADHEAYLQATENVAACRFSDRIAVVHGDFNEYYSSVQDVFDLVICNPPYFVDSYEPEKIERSMARHAWGLSLQKLIEGAAVILTGSGRLSIIIPSFLEEEAIELASGSGLNLQRSMAVIPVPGRPAKRCCLEFAFPREKTEKETLVIEEGGRHKYSKAYRALTREFYRDF